MITKRIIQKCEFYFSFPIFVIEKKQKLKNCTRLLIS